MTSTEFHLSALPLGQPAAAIVRWLKRPGDRLAQGEPLLIVLGERAELLLPAPAEGVLEHLLVSAGAAVRAGEPLASIRPSQPAPAPARAAQAAQRPVRATPLARRLAGALGVELGRLAGSGPGGAIRRADVLATARPAPAVPAAPERPAALIAEHAAQGLAVMRADLSPVLAVCAARAGAFARRGLLLDPLICVAAAVTEALLRHPLIAGRWYEDCIRVPRRINLALSQPGDTRLIENAHHLSLRGLARAYAQAQAPGERPRSFTITQALASQWFCQPAPAPGSALTIGAAQPRPIASDAGVAERIAVRPSALLALAYDIRLIGQREADAFLGEVVARLGRFSADVAGV